ncbi:MAG: phosphatidylserine decarboxylase family protein [Ignavibacteria bacterium]|nr:phosphatidylserine decarboxylase family protein [Ignavibacteria bacterium]
MITKYGYDVFFTIAVVCLIGALLALFLVEPKIPKFALVSVSVLFLAFAANFFRDPNRTTPSGAHLVMAPADGKVICVRSAEENEFLKSPATQISIFMSPLNVHVNRNPISGTVRHTRYVKGKYFAAFEDKASEKNEQMIVGIENSHGRILFKQIAGFIARRIVCTLRPGDEVRAGDRFGMIKFGSRVDVFVPADATVRTRVGDHAVAGETVLAELK